MPGTFSKSNRPRRPGAYTNFVATTPTIIPPSSAATVAIPITHDWGPFQVVQPVSSYSEFQALYGSSVTVGSFAVKQAFRGEDVAGRGGAGTVLVFRTGASASAKAVKTLNNTTPVAAITLTARYQGTKGNTLTVTTQDNASDNTKNDLIIYLGTTEVERFTYTDSNITDLAAQINGTTPYTAVTASDWVVASAVTSGVALAAVTTQAFTGGNDGTTLTGTEWTGAMSAFEVERFGVLAPYDLTDGTILGSLKTWAVNLNSKGKRFMVVVGGASDESISTAVTRSGTLADANFINAGVGHVTDTDSDATVLYGSGISTSQLAPRLAGILAARGESESLTFARLGGLTLVNGPVEADILKGFDGGVLVLARDSNQTAPVRIEKGLTTYIGGDSSKPYLIYRNPKFVRTMQGIEMEITEWAEENIVGQVQVSDKVREAVLGEMKNRLAARVATGVLQPNPTVQIDPDPPPTAADEFIALLYGITFGRSVEQVFNTISIA